MASAMNALSKPGLNRADIQRFRNVVSAVKAYQRLFAEYVDYRKIEIELVDLQQKYAQLAKNMSQKAPSVRRTWQRVIGRPRRNRTVFLKDAETADSNSLLKNNRERGVKK